MKKTSAVKFFSGVLAAVVLTTLVLQPKTDTGSFKAHAAENPAAQTPETESVSLAFYGDSPYALVDGVRRSMGGAARMDSDSLLAPLRFISEAYGAVPEWNQSTQTATVLIQGKMLSFTVGEKKMLADGKEISMDAPVILSEGKTYIPVKALAQALGVEYTEEGKAAAVGKSVNIQEVASKLGTLPVVGSREKFAELMEQLRTNEEMYYAGISVNQFGVMRDGALNGSEQPEAMPVPTAPAAMEERSSSPAGEQGSADYSGTNVQVEGVDEADVIKTDGEYIYYARANSVSIVKAYPADSMELASTLGFADSEGFSPSEMYVDGNELVIIGNGMKLFYVNGIPNYQSVTRAYVYDITDKENPKKVRELESEGNYLSSRKIGKTVYMLSSSWIYNVFNGIYPVPFYRDTAVSTEYQEISYDRMYYFPNFTQQNYLFITGFETNKPEQEAKIETYLGSGQSVYSSMENMYIAATEYPSIMPQQSGRMRPSYEPETAVYKFALDNGGVFYAGKQNIPGSILNQFSMDEYNGYFRIATTDYDENMSQKNGLYVLDKDLEITGKIDDIAPGEQIYSARFTGDRAYMVTFKTVDPLFVIDLADPNKPEILGALKIPGYSNYLHPYDENHVIGIGKDTVEYNGTALYQGMKISLFDVSDVSNPKELFVESIGDRGTDSPVLYNHKALLFDKNKDILAFPISVSILTPEQRADEWQYGSFAFQGAYVYGIDLQNGFNLKGKITHMSEEDLLKAGMYSWDYSKAVERILYIGDNLYTASQSLVKATGMTDMKDVGSVELE